MDISTSIASVIFVLLAITLAVYLQVLLIRWVFKIERQLLNQRATVWLLIKLCERTGVDPEEIKTIMELNGVK